MKHEKKKADLAGSVTFCAEEGYGVSITGEYRKKTVADILVDMVREREKAGFKTYGKPLFHDAKSCLEWLDEAIEEDIDRTKYLIAAREQLERIIKDG